MCCGRFLSGTAVPETAEELMRSRYSAYVFRDIDYLKATLWPKYQKGFDAAGTATWAKQSLWIGLDVLQTEKGGPTDMTGTVLFVARYIAEGALRCHRELSLFRKRSSRWFYVEALREHRHT